MDGQAVTQVALEAMTPTERAEMDVRMSQPDGYVPIMMDMNPEQYKRPPMHKPMFLPPVVTSVDILKQGVKEQGDRAQFYDAPAGERSMAKAVAAFNAVFNANMTEVQGWQFMELLKMVRSSQGKPRLDNYVDGASYCSLAGECAMKELA